MGTDSSNWHLELTYDQWIALSVSGPRPSARYKVFFVFCLFLFSEALGFVWFVNLEMEKDKEKNMKPFTLSLPLCLNYLKN